MQAVIIKPWQQTGQPLTVFRRLHEAMPDTLDIGKGLVFVLARTTLDEAVGRIPESQDVIDNAGDTFLQTDLTGNRIGRVDADQRVDGDQDHQAGKAEVDLLAKAEFVR